MSAAACPFYRCFFLDDLMLMTRYLYIEHLISTDIDIQVTLEKSYFLNDTQEDVSFLDHQFVNYMAVYVIYKHNSILFPLTVIQHL